MASPASTAPRNGPQKEAKRAPKGHPKGAQDHPKAPKGTQGCPRSTFWPKWGSPKSIWKGNFQGFFNIALAVDLGVPPPSPPHTKMTKIWPAVPPSDSLLVTKQCTTYQPNILTHRVPPTGAVDIY